LQHGTHTIDSAIDFGSQIHDTPWLPLFIP
jgi:hypothetical protein